jgi:DnaK suppressor protein
LEENKERLERELKSFAEKDKKPKGDWDTRYPKFGDGKLEEEGADEVEEYSNLLPIENTLELELEKVNMALEKFKKGGYGVCEKCHRSISESRLKVYPQARYCKKCEEIHS